MNLNFGQNDPHSAQNRWPHRLPPGVSPRDDPELIGKALQEGFEKSARRRWAFLIRELFKRPPLKKPEESEVKEGNIVSWPWKDGEYHSFPEKLPRTASFHEAYVTIELPHGIVDDLNQPDPRSPHHQSWQSGPEMLKDVLLHMCEFPVESIAIGNIIDQDKVKITGYSVMIDKSHYQKLAYDALHIMADPKLGTLMTGGADGDNYRHSLADPDSELSEIVMNLCRHGGLMTQDFKALILNAQDMNNPEFAQRISDYVETVRKDRGGDISSGRQ